jgi:O-antigen ligase
MSTQDSRRGEVSGLVELMGRPQFSAALSRVIVGTAFLTYLLRNVIGEAGLLAVVVGLVLLAAIGLVGQRESLEWRGFLPISLAVFLGWSAISVFYSQFQWLTLGSIAYQLAFAALGIYVALARDFIQIVRTVGDVLRAVIALSLILEFVVGVLLDTSFPFLGIVGNLGDGGPISGITGSRDNLWPVALVALVTFGTELLTRSIGRGLGILSIAAAVVTILLTHSPVGFGVLGVLGVASLALLGLRRVAAARRRYWLWGVGIAALIAVVLAWVYRDGILALLGATGALKYRVGVWNDLFPFIQMHALEGWGWVGTWPTNVAPFETSIFLDGYNSALNAYLDVWFQLGFVGLLAFLVFVGLAIVKSWILATQKRSRIFVWPALVLVALLVTDLTQSGILVEWGWLVVVVCAVKSAQHLRWRTPLTE